MWRPCQGWREGRRCLMLLRVLPSESVLFSCFVLVASACLCNAVILAYAPAVEVRRCPQSPKRFSPLSLTTDLFVVR